MYLMTTQISIHLHLYAKDNQDLSLPATQGQPYQILDVALLALDVKSLTDAGHRHNQSQKSHHRSCVHGLKPKGRVFVYMCPTDASGPQPGAVCQLPCDLYQELTICHFYHKALCFKASYEVPSLQCVAQSFLWTAPDFSVWNCGRSSRGIFTAWY
ncbi:hypothetical protein EYF80_007553 [Liparis tanakae]|uniref:Uncharacterized protein n=1 Tax=Liparis tanakae TaxID=230148 RepID=A0A4Z2IW43_9TELE|nr:hypothetical protein EYF80_007553 [Liparis tanakae]